MEINVFRSKNDKKKIEKEVNRIRNKRIRNRNRRRNKILKETERMARFKIK